MTTINEDAERELHGCACRWDNNDNRLVTCERHAGWLEVIHEWSERAKVAEAKLDTHPTPAAAGELPELPKPFSWASTIKCTACGAPYSPPATMAGGAAQWFGPIPPHACRCGNTQFGSTFSSENVSPAQYTADQMHAYAREAVRAALASRPAAEAQGEAVELHAFKNFHRLLCERFGYCHDEKDWQRDQVSLIEFLAEKLKSGAAQGEDMETRADGERVAVRRWEWGIRRIVAILWGNRHAFEIDDVVEAVRKIAPPRVNDDGSDDEGLVAAAERGFALASPSSEAQGEAVAWHVEWVMPTDKADRARWVKLCANERDALDYKARYPDTVITPLYAHPASPSSAAAQAVPTSRGVPALPQGSAARFIVCGPTAGCGRAYLDNVPNCPHCGHFTPGYRQAVPTTGGARG